MKALIAEFGDRGAEDITPGEIRMWLDSRAATWTLATRQRHLALLKMVYRVAREYEKIKINPVREVKQRKEHNECIVILEEGQEARLRQVSEKSYSEHMPEFEIGLLTGMRQSEQFIHTTWEQVFLDTGEIRLPDSKVNEPRIVQLNSRARAILCMLRESSLGTGRLFWQNKVPRWFEDACRDAGFDRQAPRKERITWHSLRHTFITRLIRAGVDLKTVQTLAGHKDIKMTARYTHLANDATKKGVERLPDYSATTTATAPLAASLPGGTSVEKVQ